MILEFGNEWIEIINYTPFRFMKYYHMGRATDALPYIIKNWSADVEINNYTVAKLSKEVVDKIIKKMLKNIEFIGKFGYNELIIYTKSFLSGQVAEDENIKKLYSDYFLPTTLVTDHKGNLVLYWEPGSLFDQPWDLIQYYYAYKPAFIEYSNEQMKKHSK